jgi:Signal transduction histidine kinase
LGVIITYFIVSMMRHQRRNMELQKLSIIAEITQIEKERARIAHDLHDELGPLLAAVKMKISSFELSEEQDKSEMLKTNNHIDDILKRIREISFDLMPSSLLRKGVTTAIKEFVDLLNNNSSIKFYFECDNNLQVNEQKSINIYRIVQEIVHNTIKHSKASTLNIELKKIKNKLLLLQLSDNGIGFNYEKESEENPGFGLRSLLRRTELIGGTMFLDSKIGKGTTYTFEIPLQYG